MSCTLHIRLSAHTLLKKTGLESRVISTASFQKEQQSYCHLAILHGSGAWFFEREILGEALSFPMVERLDADLLAIDRQREFSIQFYTEGIWECFSSFAIDRLWDRFVLFAIYRLWERCILFAHRQALGTLNPVHYVDTDTCT